MLPILQLYFYAVEVCGDIFKRFIWYDNDVNLYNSTNFTAPSLSRPLLTVNKCLKFTAGQWGPKARREDKMTTKLLIGWAK